MTTVADYDNFRLIVCSSQADPPMNHQGIAFWGDRTPAGDYGYGDCILFTPPNTGTWDYKLRGRAPGKSSFQPRSRKGRLHPLAVDAGRAPREPHHGTVRMAVDGIEVISYVDSDLPRRKKGPIGLQAHGGSHDVRYRDIYIEVDPKSDKLLTVKISGRPRPRKWSAARSETVWSEINGEPNGLSTPTFAFQLHKPAGTRRSSSA